MALIDTLSQILSGKRVPNTSPPVNSNIPVSPDFLTGEIPALPAGLEQLDAKSLNDPATLALFNPETKLDPEAPPKDETRFGDTMMKNLSGAAKTVGGGLLDMVKSSLAQTGRNAPVWNAAFKTVGSEGIYPKGISDVDYAKKLALQTGDSGMLDSISKMQSSGDTISTKDKLGFANDLRKEFKQDQRVKNFMDASSYFRNAMETSKNPGKGQALTLLYSYAKMMDPGGRVTASDIESGQNTGNLPDQVKAWIDRWLGSGKALGPEQLKALQQEIKSSYSGRVNEFNGLREDYVRKALLQGVDPDLALSSVDVLNPEDLKIGSISVDKNSAAKQKEADEYRPAYEAAKRVFYDSASSKEDKEAAANAIVEYENKYK